MSAANGSDGFGPSLDLSAAEPLLRRLELAVRTKLDGLLQGNYVGLVPGPGTEAGESRQYVSGDDVRRMDWPVTARTTIPHVRQTIVDRELETWLVVDLSPSLDFGTARSEKRELALAAITAVVHLTVRGGNRIGAVVGNGEHSYRIPALPGVAHARHLVRQIAATPRAPESRGGDLAAMLAALRRPQRRRGLVAVISDFLDGGTGAIGGTSATGGVSGPGRAAGSPDWERPLRALSQRHQLLGIEVLDPRELELPAAGLITFVDPETGRELEVQTDSSTLRRDYASAAQAQRGAIAAALRRAGAAHLQLRTDRDWISDVVAFVLARRQLAGGALGGSTGGLR